MPLDRADRNPELARYLVLTPPLEIVGDDNLAPQSRQIRYLAPQPRQGLVVESDLLVLRLGYLVERQSDRIFRAVAVVVAEQIVRNSPYKPRGIANIAARGQRTIGAQHYLLRKILGVLARLAAFQREAVDRLKIGRKDFTGFVRRHVSALLCEFVYESFHLYRHTNLKRLGF